MEIPYAVNFCQVAFLSHCLNPLARKNNSGKMTIKMIPPPWYDSEKQTPHGNMPGRGERGIDIAVKSENMDPYTVIPHNFSRRKIHLLIFSIITRVCCFPCG